MCSSDLSSDMGAEMAKPMAVVTIGGLTYGTLLTLIVIPCIYDVFIREKKEKRSSSVFFKEQLPGSEQKCLVEQEQLPGSEQKCLVKQEQLPGSGQEMEKTQEMSRKLPDTARKPQERQRNRRR